MSLFDGRSQRDRLIKALQAERDTLKRELEACKKDVVNLKKLLKNK